jgi:hypothetical protein
MHCHRIDEYSKIGEKLDYTLEDLDEIRQQMETISQKGMCHKSQLGQGSDFLDIAPWKTPRFTQCQENRFTDSIPMSSDVPRSDIGQSFSMLRPCPRCATDDKGCLANSATFYTW